MENITRADLKGRPARTVRRGISYKADLLVYRVNGEDVLLKDYGRKTGIWRDVLGVMFTRREARALRALSGVEGFPQFRGRPDPYCVAMTFINGKQVKKADPSVRGNEDFVRQLRHTVHEMHRRGVVHLDLKHRSNLMVSGAGQPVILDFESALCFRRAWLIGRLAVVLLGQLDWLAVQNWTRRLCPHMLALSNFNRRRARLARGLRQWWLPRRIMDAMLDIIVPGGGRTPGSTEVSRARTERPLSGEVRLKPRGSRRGRAAPTSRCSP
jgi:predicted Ser/Thr protein kinase